jgi:hypothetical protein
MLPEGMLAEDGEVVPHAAQERSVDRLDVGIRHLVDLSERVAQELIHVVEVLHAALTARETKPRPSWDS